MLETLLAPPFAADPPIKLNVPAKTLGLVLAILGAVSVLFGVLGVFALLGLSALATAFGGIFLLAAIGVIIGVIGAIVETWGAYQMYQGNRDGKRLAIYGLLINVAGSLVATIGGSGGLGGWIVGVLISFVVYYLIVISRFPDEPPVVAKTT
ncbi:MAG TPA: hypothetical protein VIN34_09115 [Candidatus Limnocylindria bacterium]|jgi:MFS family permease